LKAELADLSRLVCSRELVVENPHAFSARTRIAAPVSVAKVIDSTCPSLTVMRVLLFF